MTDELVKADQQARIDALDVSRSFIVQAPAGSGKTELLIQRYLHLLAIVAEPEEIVAITFTRKAAQEMRQRIVDALQKAESGQVATEHHQVVTQKAAVAALERDRRLGWHLVQSPRRMRIQTLDAFNAGIAKSLPVSSGLGGIGRTVADEEMQSLYREAAMATIEWLGSGEAMDMVVEKVLSHLDNNVGIFVNHLSRMLQSRDQWLSFLGSGQASTDDLLEVRSKLEQAIANVVGKELQRADEMLPEESWPGMLRLIDFAAANLTDLQKQDDPVVGIQGLAKKPGTATDDAKTWQAVAHFLLTQKGDFRKRVNKNNGFPPDKKEQLSAMMELTQQLAQVEGLADRLDGVRRLPPVRYSDEQWDVLTALFRLLPQAVGELRLLFGQRSVSDHIEVALAASAALGSFDAPGDISLGLDYKIQHLLVDEMQDTSLGQYRLLEMLVEGWTGEDGKTLFCVGDPMQSIYRFRDAEVGQFVAAREGGVGSVRPEYRILRRNFRSGENLVHWFNTVFSQVLPEHDDVVTGAIAYAESVPVERHAESGDVQLHALIDCDAFGESQYSANIIRRCLTDNPGDSIAVLVRSRTQLTELLADFRTGNIPFQAVEIDRLTDLPEIIDLLALTRALSHDGDRVAWLALLHGPWVGLDWHDILQLVTNDSRSTLPELLEDPQRLARLSADARERVVAFRETIERANGHQAADSLRSRIERCWFALGGPCILQTSDQLENVYQYLDVLEKIETAGMLADPGELASLLDQERVTSTAGEDGNLQIMTMHKAKGLQFDHVFVYGLGRATRASQKAVLSWLTVPDGLNTDMIVSPIGSRAILEHDPLHQFIEVSEKVKQQNELDRLLYVACTRAKKSLHLIGSAKSTAAGDKLRGPIAGSLLHRLWPAVEPAFQIAFLQQTERESAAATAEHEQYRHPVCRRLSADWQADTVPPVPGSSSVPELGEQEQKVQYYWVGELARHAGTIVHRWLHRIVVSGEIAVEIAERHARSKRWASQLGVAAADIEALCERVSSALDAMLKDPKGRWLLEGDGFSEMPVTGLWNDRLTSIVIDRIRVDEHGVHWIVDYKTGSHEGGDLATFLDHEADRHRAQLRKYAEIYSALTDAPVKTALYFPLLQEFREV